MTQELLLRTGEMDSKGLFLVFCPFKLIISLKSPDGHILNLILRWSNKSFSLQKNAPLVWKTARLKLIGFKGAPAKRSNENRTPIQKQLIKMEKSLDDAAD